MPLQLGYWVKQISVGFCTHRRTRCTAPREEAHIDQVGYRVKRHACEL